MKALTLVQPWATLMALGVKRVETRSWKTEYRGPLLIHAAKALPANWRQFANDDFTRVLEPLVGLNRYGAPNLDRLPLGAILASVELVDCVPAESTYAREWSQGERSFGDYSIGRWAWLTQGVARYAKPIPCSGRQRIWDVPTTLERFL